MAAGKQILDEGIGVGSVEHLRTALAASSHPDTIVRFSAGTRTAADAVAAVGCTVGQLANSIVFRCGVRAVVVITSGANRVDPAGSKQRSGSNLTGQTPSGSDFEI